MTASVQEKKIANTEVKTKRFVIWTTQNNVHNFGIAINKATGTQTYINTIKLKHLTESVNVTVSGSTFQLYRVLFRLSVCGFPKGNIHQCAHCFVLSILQNVMFKSLVCFVTKPRTMISPWNCSCWTLNLCLCWSMVNTQLGKTTVGETEINSSTFQPFKQREIKRKIYVAYSVPT